MVALTTDDDRGGSAYSEYFYLRADLWGWGNADFSTANVTSSGYPTDDAGWAEFRQKMEGALVDLTIARTGAVVKVTAVSTCKDGTVYTESYTQTVVTAVKPYVHSLYATTLITRSIQNRPILVRHLLPVRIWSARQTTQRDGGPCSLTIIISAAMLEVKIVHSYSTLLITRQVRDRIITTGCLSAPMALSAVEVVMLRTSWFAPIDMAGVTAITWVII